MRSNKITETIERLNEASQYQFLPLVMLGSVIGFFAALIILPSSASLLMITLTSLFLMVGSGLVSFYLLSFISKLWSSKIIKKAEKENNFLKNHKSLHEGIEIDKKYLTKKDIEKYEEFLCALNKSLNKNHYKNLHINLDEIELKNNYKLSILKKIAIKQEKVIERSLEAMAAFMISLMLLLVAHMTPLENEILKTISNICGSLTGLYFICLFTYDCFLDAYRKRIYKTLKNKDLKILYKLIYNEIFKNDGYLHKSRLEEVSKALKHNKKLKYSCIPAHLFKQLEENTTEEKKKTKESFLSKILGRKKNIKEKEQINANNVDIL